MSAPEGPFGRRSPAPTPPPEPKQEPPAPRAGVGGPASPRGISSVTWILGVVVVLALTYITVNTITTDKPGSRGIPVGEEIPPFAAPLALGSLDGDANVAQEATDDVRRTACEVRGREIFNTCEALDRGPLVLAFLATRSKRCEDQIDLVDRLGARYPDVSFAVVAVRGERDDIRKTIREHGWKIPVAWDRDGAVSNIYAVAICPTMTFVRMDGRVAATTLGLASEAEIVRHVEAIRST